MAQTEKTLAWRPPPSVAEKLAGAAWLLTGATGFLGEPPRYTRRHRQQGLGPPLAPAPAAAAAAATRAANPPAAGATVAAHTALLRATNLLGLGSMPGACACAAAAAGSGHARCRTPLANHAPTRACPIIQAALFSPHPQAAPSLSSCCATHPRASWCVQQALAWGVRP